MHARRSEVFLMMRTLRDMNMSKFVAEDVPLFISLIDDLFPAQKAERTHFPEISAALDKARALCSCSCCLARLCPSLVADNVVAQQSVYGSD